MEGLLILVHQDFKRPLISRECLLHQYVISKGVRQVHTLRALNVMIHVPFSCCFSFTNMAGAPFHGRWFGNCSVDQKCSSSANEEAVGEGAPKEEQSCNSSMAEPSPAS